MAQELGRMERPSTESFRGKRKLLLVPRVYAPPTDEEEGIAVLQRYWDQIESQVASLESRLGTIRSVYHEGMTEGGEESLKYMATVDERCHALIQSKIRAGASLEATEDGEVLVETLDLQRCLMLPFSGDTVALRLREWLTEGLHRRYEYVSRRIDDTLGEDQVGLLFISERHQVQFPADVEVFFVAPPALDEFRRWLDGWIAKQQAADSQGRQEEGDPSEGQ